MQDHNVHLAVYLRLWHFSSDIFLWHVCCFILNTIFSDRAKRKLNLDISMKRSILAQRSLFSCPFESMYQAFTLIYASQSQFRIQLIGRPKCFIAPSYHGGPLYIQESCGIGTPSKHSPEIFLLIIFSSYPSSQFYSFFASTDISITEFEKMFTYFVYGGILAKKRKGSLLFSMYLKKESYIRRASLVPLFQLFSHFL